MVEQRAKQEALDHCVSEKQLFMFQRTEMPGPDIVVSGHCVMPAERETLESEVAALKDATTTEFADYTLVATADRSTQYYFTKPNHRAYPWAVKVLTLPAPPGAPATPQADRMRWEPAKPKNSPFPPTPEATGIVVSWMQQAYVAARFGDAAHQPAK